MPYLPSDDSNVKPISPSANPTETPRPDKPDFARRAAQVELGRAYVPPEHADFVDRSPEQDRAAWTGASK